MCMDALQKSVKNSGYIVKNGSFNRHFLRERQFPKAP